MKIKIMKTLLSVAVLAAMSNTAMAVGTDSGTIINNTASITYSVGSTVQAPIASSPTGNSAPNTVGTPTAFKVDKKIDLTVTGNGDFNVPTNATGQLATFTVSNDGNSQETFDLTTAQVVTNSPNDVFDTSACTIQDSTAPGVDITSIVIPQTAPNNTKTINVKCTTPINDGTTVVNGAKSEIELMATAMNGAAAYAETASDNIDPLVVDVVLADGIGAAQDQAFGTSIGAAGNRNASHSAKSTYVIQTADLKVTKASDIYSDPSNDTTNPKRIPGALIKYTITVANTGSVPATGLVIADHIPDNMTYADSTTTPAAPAGCISSIGTCSLNPTLTIGGQPAGGKPGVESSSIDVPAAGNVTVTFYAKVN